MQLEGSLCIRTCAQVTPLWKTHCPPRPLLCYDCKHIASGTTEWFKESSELCCQSLHLHHCPKGPFPWLCSPFSSLPRVELTGTHFTSSSHHWWAGQPRLPSHPSKQGLLRGAGCWLPQPTTSTGPSSESC